LEQHANLPPDDVGLGGDVAAQHESIAGGGRLQADQLAQQG
jgi:hypothetical protein